jgi:hypothetical protein
MVDFGIERDDFVRLNRIPKVVFRVELVQYEPHPTWLPWKGPWQPRAYLHFAGGPDKFDFSLLARWEPLEDLIKLNEMEALARVSAVVRR